MLCSQVNSHIHLPQFNVTTSFEDDWFVQIFS